VKKVFKMVIVAVGMFVLSFGTAQAESSTSFSVSASFVTTPVQGVQQTRFSASGSITENFQISQAWFGVEGGINASLDSIQPFALAKWYSEKPGKGLNLGLGGSYFWSSSYAFGEAFIQLGFEIPMTDKMYLAISVKPGLKFAETGGPGGFQIPASVYLVFRL
jgi:hypothetical protein